MVLDFNETDACFSPGSGWFLNYGCVVRISFQGHNRCRFDLIDGSMVVMGLIHSVIDECIECVDLDSECELESRTVKVLVKHVLHEMRSSCSSWNANLMQYDFTFLIPYSLAGWT